MKQKNVLVAGGGIAGLAAANELSEAGINVFLIEKTNFLGGHAIGYTCKAAEECLQCGACSAEKALKEVMSDDGITIYLNSTIENITSGNSFSVTIKKRPVFIDKSKCTNCGICYEKSPEPGAVLRGYSKNNSPLYAIAPDKLSTHADFFKTICPENAISIDEKSTTEKIAADAVVVATGFTAFDPKKKPTYGYGKFKNVISGLDMERIKRKNGTLVRPSDGKPPRKIAFIQCVGSRDERLGNLWCSQVCCPYSLKTAKSIKHNAPETELTIFYMDIQNTGNNFSTFYDGCKTDMRFVRSIPVDIFPAAEDSLSLRVLNEENGTTVMEPFDLVVLSVGIMPNPDNKNLATLLGADLTVDGFFAGSSEPGPTATATAGIFAAGTATGPKSITDSIAEAGRAAYDVVNYLGGAK